MEKNIPLKTVYHFNGKDRWQTKEPMYQLRSASEEKARQDRIAEHFDLSFWFGTSCEKCCGVYPEFFSEESFRDYGYYVCLVCGKESKHKPMSWQARKAWNQGEFEWIPEKYNNQLTIFDF